MGEKYQKLKIKNPINSKYGHFMSGNPELKGFIMEFISPDIKAFGVRVVGKIEMEDDHFTLPFNYMDGIDVLNENDLKILSKYDLEYLIGPDPGLPVFDVYQKGNIDYKTTLNDEYQKDTEPNKKDKLDSMKKKCIVEYDISEFMKSPKKIIVKSNDKFYGFKREKLVSLLQKDHMFTTGEKVTDEEISIIVDNNYSFYEILNTGDNTYCLVPYNTDTFINKYKSY